MTRMLKHVPRSEPRLAQKGNNMAETIFTWQHTIDGKEVHIPILHLSPEGKKALAINESCCCYPGCPYGCPKEVAGLTFCTLAEAEAYIEAYCSATSADPCCYLCGGYVRENPPGASNRFDPPVRCAEDSHYGPGTGKSLPSYTAFCCEGACNCSGIPNWIKPATSPCAGLSENPCAEESGCNDSSSSSSGSGGSSPVVPCGYGFIRYFCSMINLKNGMEGFFGYAPCNGSNCAYGCYKAYCIDCELCEADDTRWQCEGKPAGSFPLFCDEESVGSCCDGILGGIRYVAVTCVCNGNTGPICPP